MFWLTRFSVHKNGAIPDFSRYNAISISNILNFIGWILDELDTTVDLNGLTSHVVGLGRCQP